MTIKEFKAILDKYSDNALVLVACDSEQNTVSPLLGLESGVIGTKYQYGDDYVYEDGKDFECFDYEANKGKQYIIIVPKI